MERTRPKRPLIINAELRDLLPPLEQAQQAMLEAQIMEEGCLSPLVVWKETDTLVDGHNRYDICKRNHIPYDVVYKSFPTMADAMQYMVDNNWNRRNLTVPQRIEARHKIEDKIREEAKERQGKRNDIKRDNIVENFPPSDDDGKSRDKLGTLAGVSGKTYEKGAHVIDNAPAPIRQAWQRQEISTDMAFRATKLPEPEQQQAIAAIEKGEAVKKEVGRVLKSAALQQETARPYDIDDLVGEIIANGEDFERTIRVHIMTRLPVVEGEGARQQIANAIGKIISNLETLKGDMQHE